MMEAASVHLGIAIKEAAAKHLYHQESGMNASQTVYVQTFWASSVEERAKVDLKFHFMKKTLNEYVSLCLVCCMGEIHWTWSYVCV